MPAVVVDSGLLLAPHLDAMFDAGLMSVGDDGTVVVAASLSTKQRRLLGLTAELTVHGLRADHRKCLSFHRKAVWRA